MPDKRTHRGAHPDDRRLFSPAAGEVLTRAVGDLSWLLSNGYAMKSSLKLVGDHLSLTQRQRMAVMRCACADGDIVLRHDKRAGADELAGKMLLLDGYNVITTVEAALSGGVILCGRDGCYRDLASVHGTYRKVEETIPAVKLIAQVTNQLGVHGCHWYLDSPVSNSGRLKTLIAQLAEQEQWNWQVELVTSPDGVLARADDIVATADSDILNRCRRWFDLARAVIAQHVPDAWLIDLGQTEACD